MFPYAERDAINNRLKLEIATAVGSLVDYHLPTESWH